MHITLLMLQYLAIGLKGEHKFIEKENFRKFIITEKRMKPQQTTLRNFNSTTFPVDMYSDHIHLR